MTPSEIKQLTPDGYGGDFEMTTGGKPMTNYNERLDEVLDDFFTIGTERHISELKQAITSLIKELVAEAKPKRKTLAELNGGWRADVAQGFNECLDAYEQNLLKALEEV